MRKLLRLTLPVLVLLTAGAAPPEPKPTAALPSEDTNFAGVTAEVAECKVKDGVLSVKIRLRNGGNSGVRVKLIENRDFDKYYVTAGSKKYFVLSDDEKVPLAPGADGFGSLSVEIPKGGTWTWWAKYPAPPDSETKINYVWPLGAPFEDVPISR
jgi:hypothetical protein